jgi:hypothetical protein
MFVSPSVIKTIANQQLSLSYDSKTICWNRCFNAIFGCSPKVTARLWNGLVEQRKVPSGGKVMHLLWTLAFLKLYDTESVYCTMFGVTEKTFRKWVWKFVDNISTIKLVRTV